MPSRRDLSLSGIASLLEERTQGLRDELENAFLSRIVKFHGDWFSVSVSVSSGATLTVNARVCIFRVRCSRLSTPEVSSSDTFCPLPESPLIPPEQLKEMFSLWPPSMADSGDQLCHPRAGVYPVITALALLPFLVFLIISKLGAGSVTQFTQDILLLELSLVL